MNNEEYLIEEAKYEGSCRIIKQLLKETFKDYKKALIYIWENKEKFNEYKPIVNDYELYLFELKEYNYLNNLNRKLQQEEIEYMIQFKKKQIPTKPTKKMKNLVDRYIRERNTQFECESFYMSKDYSTFTMNKSLNGYDVIQEIRKSAAMTIKRRIKNESKKRK